MALEGKGFYIWKVQDCEDGDPARILRRAVDSGLSHVLVKIADGTRSYNANRARPVVEALKEAGLQVWGWQFVYGRDPYGEADIAIQRVRSLGVDGFVVNAEDDYKNNRAAEAVAYMDRLNAELGDVPVALSSYRYPNYHPELPWTEFLSGCDYNMPQVYWVKADDPDKQLDRSIEQFRSIFPVRPIIPTGSAYEEFGWRPQPDHIERLLSHARDLGLPAVNFWSWDYAGSDAGADFWEVIAGFDWPVASLQPDIADVFIDALNR
ncbi:MAG: hypothetical protein GYB64_16300, partial [Chloroflexi bacterium]|nr:hypothetical protein [Chloroflexota bacterium]